MAGTINSGIKKLAINGLKFNPINIYPFFLAGFDFMVKVAFDDTAPGLPALFWNSPF
jgi:hypothetical protein